MAKRAEDKEKPRCKTKYCRKYVVKNGYCKKCNEKRLSASETASIGGNGVKSPIEMLKLDEIDRLRFVELDQMLINHKQEIQILKQTQQIEDQAYVARKNQRNTRVSELLIHIKDKEIEQRAMLKKFGEKYGFKEQDVSIDDVTGVIHLH